MRKERAEHGLIARTTEGEFVAWYSSKGLAGIDFPGSSLARESGKPVPEQVQSWHALTCEALEQVLAGRDPAKLPPLDFSIGTPFQQEVWRALARVRAGSTVSYGSIARSIGRPAAFRAVGRACGANPIPVLVPCHRVLAANSRLGGFSGGLEWKRKLLQREGLSVQ